ncbi:MAG TPA: hypothetical protein VJ850_08245 [Candidatus Limnocylindrales bacterium]|nr:hypothetical protein [Candidatus Limnocylindrales bacterium]
MDSESTRLGARDLVDIWESLPRQGWLSGAMSALAAIAREDVSALDQLSLGERNALLLRLRRAQRGDALDLVASCPVCTTTVEFTVSCSELLTAAAPPSRSWAVNAGGYRLHMRPIKVADERAAHAAAGAEEARAILASGAIARVTRGSRSIEPALLPNDALTAAGQAVLEHDRLAEIVLGVTCPECSGTWSAPLDLVRLVSEELSRLGAELIGAVDLLARTYGWTEETILGLPETRRGTYMALAGS